MVKPYRRRQRGYVLLVALFVTTFALAAGALTAGSLHLRMQLLRQQERDLRLTALLDAAMARAMAELVEDASYGGTEGESLGGGKYSISAQREGSNRVNVRLQVVYGGVGRGAFAVLELYPVVRVMHWRIEAYNPRSAETD